MFTILLIIIYVSFISLGLPDGLLGSAWPSMHIGLQVPVSYAGIVSMIIAGGTIISSLQSDRLIKKLRHGKSHGSQRGHDGGGLVRLFDIAFLFDDMPVGDTIRSWRGLCRRGAQQLCRAAL